jgi:hypothetical protein
MAALTPVQVAALTPTQTALLTTVQTAEVPSLTPGLLAGSPILGILPPLVLLWSPSPSTLLDVASTPAPIMAMAEETEDVPVLAPTATPVIPAVPAYAPKAERN